MSLDKVTLFDEKSLIHISRPFKNLINNGDMSIHKDGILKKDIKNSISCIADSYVNNLVNCGTWTQEIVNDFPEEENFVSKSLKITSNSSLVNLWDESYNIISQGFTGESLQILKKGTKKTENLVLSFWVKSNIAGNYTCELYDEQNLRQISKNYTINEINVWEKKIINFPGDSQGLILNDSKIKFWLNFWLLAGKNFYSGIINESWELFNNTNRTNRQINLASKNNNYWQITSIQLEVGTINSPFEYMPINLRNVLNGNFLTNDDKSTITIGTNNTTRLEIDSQGFLWNYGNLISQKEANQQNNFFILFTKPNNQLNLELNSIKKTGILAVNQDISLIFSTAGKERLKITPKGFIGINTQEPSQPLHISGDYPAGNGPFLYLENTNDSSNNSLGPGILLNTGKSGSNKLFIGSYQNNGNFNVSFEKIDLNGESIWGQALTITQASNIGIGTNIPSSRLEILDSNQSDNRRILRTSNSTNIVDIVFNLTAGAFNPISAIGDIGFIFSKNAINTGNLVIAPWTNNQTGIRMTPTSVNIFNVNGIKFSPLKALSDDLNTLDDYEEGSWIPFIASPARVAISALLNAQFTKIGRQVTAIAYFNINNTSGAIQTNMTISGLPFDCQGVYGFVTGYFRASNQMKNITATCYVEIRTKTIFLFNINLPIGVSEHMYYISYFA